MNTTQIVTKFNLKDNIDYNDLSKRINEFLAGDSDSKIDTLIELLETVIELDWSLYQYNEMLQVKTYSELYSMIMSTYALNPKLGKVPNNLIQLDIKLRRMTDTEKVESEVNKVFIPMILELLLKFNLDIQLLKIIDVILIARKVCIKYHKKVKLTLENEAFDKLKSKYPKEIAYFGFRKKFTEDELKDRYHKLVLKAHPDRGGSQDEFIKVRTYYKTLSKIFN
jgi:hypothetical protein